MINQRIGWALIVGGVVGIGIGIYLVSSVPTGLWRITQCPGVLLFWQISTGPNVFAETQGIGLLVMIVSIGVAILGGFSLRIDPKKTSKSLLPITAIVVFSFYWGTSKIMCDYVDQWDVALSLLTLAEAFLLTKIVILPGIRRRTG